MNLEVVILPAFGASVDEMALFKERVRKIPQNSPATTWTSLVTIGTKWDPTSL